jgi:hypothetical protein
MLKFFQAASAPYPKAASYRKPCDSVMILLSKAPHMISWANKMAFYMNLETSYREILGGLICLQFGVP